MPDDVVYDEMKFGIGQPVPRSEDPRLLTGGGNFTDDHDVAGQAYAYFVRSEIAHGEILRIDSSRASASPGVLAIYTGTDLAADGIGNIPCPAAVKSRDGSDPTIPPRPALAVGRVRHVGDPFAVVIAATLDEARDAAETIETDIAALPVNADLTQATETAVKVWDEAPDNVCLDFHWGDDEAVDAAFESASHISRIRLDNTRMVVNAMEPRAVVAEYDAAAEKFTIHVPAQGVTGYRATLANAIFNVPVDKVRVVSNDVGGSFGMKGGAFNESICTLYAARKLGRAVKWRADRSESFLSDHQGRASVLELALALDGDGNFLALRVDGYGDVGAYLTAMGPWPSTMVTSRNIISVYKTPLISYNVKVVFTNTVPTGPYRGAGRPESKFFLERLIEQAARETGIDPIALRRRNMISPDMFPHQTPVGLTYDSGEFEAILDEALERADWAGFISRKADSKARGLLRGIGLGVYLETTAPPGAELADIRFGDDGTVTLITGTKDFGGGHASPFAQVLVSRLGIPFDSVRLIQNDSDMMSPGAGGSGGSRTMIAAGGAIVEASAEIIAKGRRAAAHVLEAAEDDIEFEAGAGTFRVAGTDRAIDIMSLAAELRGHKTFPEDVPASLDTNVNHKTAPISFPNGCHVCEVEINPETGAVEIVRYTVVDDFGVVVNPMIVEGQVHGGIAQGIGQVLLENTIYDADGQLLTGSYMDYAMPRADHFPTIDFTTHSVPCTTNPLGAKGCGEAGNGGSYPSAINAILNALAEVGVQDLALPATPARVWAAIEAARLTSGSIRID